MKVKNNELLFIYNSNKISDKRALAYAKTLDKLKIREMDLSQENISEQQIVSVAEILGCKIQDLANKNQESFKEALDNNHFSDEELLKSMANNTDNIQTPIAIIGDIGEQILSEFEMIRKGLTVEGVKLGNFSQEKNIS